MLMKIAPNVAKLCVRVYNLCVCWHVGSIFRCFQRSAITVVSTILLQLIKLMEIFFKNKPYFSIKGNVEVQ